MSSYRMKYKIGATQYNIPVMDDITSGGGIPLGTILPYASNINLPPEGFLYCEGQAISRTMYADLFSLIGTTYGIGDGSTTFNLPNLVGGEFLEASGTAGTTKNAGLPNITGMLDNKTSLSSSNGYGSPEGAFYRDGTASYHAGLANTAAATNLVKFDASRSSSIYGNSQTVQPKALTVRYIIKVFDSATSSSALIDITQYASDLSTRLQRQQVPAFNRRVEIRTSQTWTAPVTGWYKFTIKGAGGGGSGGCTISSTIDAPGYGGGEGGTTFAYERMNAGDTASITIGAGGSGGSKVNGGNNVSQRGTAGGSSSVFVNSTTYSAGGGSGGGCYIDKDDCGGIGGSGTIRGCSGGSAQGGHSSGYGGGHGGGAGGANGHLTASGVVPNAGVDGGGGAGGYAAQTYAYTSNGSNGGNGYVFIEYFDPTL